MAGLLNPTDDAAIAKKMLSRMRECLEHDETLLLGKVMEREAYLQAIGGRTRLAAVLKDLENIYIRETHV